MRRNLKGLGISTQRPKLLRKIPHKPGEAVHIGAVLRDEYEVAEIPHNEVRFVVRPNRLRGTEDFRLGRRGRGLFG